MKVFLLIALATFAVASCRPAPKSSTAVPPQPTPEETLRERLNPIHQPTAVQSTPAAVPVAPEPLTIFPVPIRAWLPPAVMADQPRALPAARETGSGPSLPVIEIPPLAPIGAPERMPLPSTPLAQVAGPDASRSVTWIVSNPAPGARAPTLDFDAVTDPASDAAIPPAKGLRETPPPFLRLTIPDPFEQLATAELRRPPAENEAPFFFVPRPVISLGESTIVTAGK